MKTKSQTIGGGKQKYTVIWFIHYMSTVIILFEHDCDMLNMHYDSRAGTKKIKMYI